jgi:hypothetical protein
MLQNRPFLEVIAERSIQEVIEEEVIEGVVEQSMFMLQSLRVLQS